MATSRLRIVSFFGWSDSGKTTLVASIASACVRRGLRCGAAKSSRHPGDFGDDAKDTGRFRSAGAMPVAYVGIGPSRTTALYLRTPESPDRAWLEGLFPDVDVLLVEGLEVEGAARVLVESGERAGKRKLDEIDILVSDDGDRRSAFARLGGSAFSPNDTEAILDTLEESWKET